MGRGLSVPDHVSSLRGLWRTGDDVRPPEPPRGSTNRRWAVLVATLVAGALVLAWALRLAPGDARFYLGTVATAAVWTCGALLSGCAVLSGSAVPSGGSRRGGRRAATLLGALVVGLLLVGVFAVVALAVARVPALAVPVRHLLDHADAASLPLVALLTAVNGVAEELFFRGALYTAFRGALYTALRRHDPVLVTTVVYALVTAASGVPLLVLAAAIIGAVTALQRRVTGGVLAPSVTHVTWSLGMLLILPPLLRVAS